MDYMMIQQGLAGSGVWVATSQAKQAVEVRPSSPFEVRLSRPFDVEVRPSNSLVSSSFFADLTSLSSPLLASSSSMRNGFFPRLLLGLSSFLTPEIGFQYDMLMSSLWIRL